MLSYLLVNLLISNAVTSRRDTSILFSRFVIISLILISFLAYNNLHISPLEKGIGIYGGLFNVTVYVHSFNIFIFLISGIILGLTAFFPRKVILKEYSSLYNILYSNISYNKTNIANKTGEQFRIIEYALIIVFIITGAVFLMSTGDLVSIFLSIELQSYGLYILCTLYRNSESATASGLTYFLLGGMSSCFILLGSALLYANSGTTSLDNIYIITSISEIKEVYNFDAANIDSLKSYAQTQYLYEPYYFHMSLIILSVGFLFKVSAAPFHFWSPDVYDGIPTIVTTYVAIVAKISIFIFFLELVYYTEYYYFDFSWKAIFILSSVLSLIVGSILGLTQFRIKRLFAYSTISHVGFILLALSINSTESIQSYIFYILQYSISNLNAFIILVTIGFSFYFYVQPLRKGESNVNKSVNIDLIGKSSKISNNVLEDKNNSPIQLISQIKGYFYVNPFIAISLIITLFSFVGIPPLIGFFAKQMILSAALDSGYIFVTLIAILTSVIGAAYYLNIVKEVFFYKDEYKINPTIKEVGMKAYINTTSNKLTNSSKEISFKVKDITTNSFLSTVISVLTLTLLLFIYTPGEWFNIVSILTLILFKS